MSFTKTIFLLNKCPRKSLWHRHLGVYSHPQCLREISSRSPEDTKVHMYSSPWYEMAKYTKGQLYVHLGGRLYVHLGGPAVCTPVRPAVCTPGGGAAVCTPGGAGCMYTWGAQSV